MSYQQLITPNTNISYTGGWCERFAENTIGLSGIFPTALAAWNSGMGNHPNEQPPQGVVVPVYFSLTNVPAGHVAISLGDGRIASSTQGGTHPTAYIHPSLQDLINVYSNPAYGNGKCTYLGWSEYIGKKQVVKEGGNMVELTDAQFKDATAWKTWGVAHQAVIAKYGGPDDVTAFDAYLKDLVQWKKDGMFYQNENATLKKQLASQVTTQSIPSEVQINGVTYVKK